MDLSVNEAARRLGVSQEAVRSRLRGGDLKGRQVPRGRRQMWLVDAEDLAVWEARRRDWQEIEGRRTMPRSDARDTAGAGSLPHEECILDERDVEIARLRRQIEALKEALRALMDQ